jgi:hypothetical protein
VSIVAEERAQYGLRGLADRRVGATVGRISGRFAERRPGRVAREPGAS